MDFNRFTERTQQAIKEAQNLAMTLGHNQVESEHLLKALLTQENGIIPKLVQKLDVPQERLNQLAEQEVQKKPRVSGAGFDPEKIYISQALSALLAKSEQTAKKLKDEYVSVEHVFLEIIRTGDQTPAGRILKEFNITEQRFLQALTDLRGNQRVRSANPEATYDALNLYGIDLVAAARQGKLDPVIGRDQEIDRFFVHASYLSLFSHSHSPSQGIDHHCSDFVVWINS